MSATTFELIELARISPNPFNPRRTFDQAALDQLTESVRAKGVLEPVLVRPRNVRAAPGKMGRKEGFLLELLDEQNKPLAFALDEVYPTREAAEAVLPLYELVAGERRYRAATACGTLKTIPAMVRPMTDREAAEVAVIENDQREDVPPLEQAVGYKRLLDLGEHAESIALKIGRPVKYVAARLTLTELIPELQEGVRAGKLPFGHASLLARLQPAEQREQLGGNRLYDWNGRPRPLEELKRELQRTAVQNLSAAPWKWDDADLVPAAGTCKACSKRSGNNPTLFDDLVADGPGKNPPEVCTDRACYAEKKQAFIQLQLKKAEADTGAPPLRVSGSFYSREKDTLSADRYEIVSKKDARAAKPGTLKTAVVVSGADNVGHIVQVRVKAEPRASSSGSASKAREKEQAERKRKAETGKAAAAKANAAAAQKAEKVFGELAEWPSLALPMLRAVITELVDNSLWDVTDAVAERRAILPEPVKGKKATAGARDNAALIQTHVNNCQSGPELWGLFIELVAATVSDGWGNQYSARGVKDAPFWKVFGVDQAKLIKEAETAYDAAEKAKAESAKKPAAKKEKRKAGAK